MVMFLQSSMGELVNVSWAVVLVKSTGAANGQKRERGKESDIHICPTIEAEGGYEPIASL